jgi:hypothetical protein
MRNGGRNGARCIRTEDSWADRQRSKSGTLLCAASSLRRCGLASESKQSVFENDSRQTHMHGTDQVEAAATDRVRSSRGGSAC